MKNFQLLCCLLILTFIFSCNQDDDISTDPVPPNPTFYYNLNIDSYWIYQWYNIDTLGVETVRVGSIDTIRNIADTIIDGNQYVIQRSNILGGSQSDRFLRYSDGDLVNEKGTILFSSTNFTDILHRDTVRPDEPLLISSYQMASSEPEEITTMAGTFSCLNYQGTHESFNINSPGEIRMTDNYYSIEIGEIQSSIFFFSSSLKLERRLVEFELQ